MPGAISLDWHAPYIGVPFGEGPGEATCWTLVCRVLREQRGLDLPVYGEISARDLAAVARAMEAGQAAEWADPWMPVCAPRAFDLALMTAGGRRVCHVGIMVDRERLLHVERATHSCVVDLTHLSVRGRLRGFRRHVGA